MKISQLECIGEAPAKGTQLIYTRKQVIFEEYASLDSFKNNVSDQDVLEIHLFDDTKEYRALATESKRFSKGVLEHVAQFADDDAVYKETCMLEDGGSITVLNHITYNDENGMAFIDDYRIKRG